MADINELLEGSVDMHIHTSPDTKPRRFDAVEAARQAQQAGMKAIVIKNHSYITAPLATIASQMVPGVTVIGGICLNYELGGLNSHAVDATGKLGGKVVWMPTTSAINSRARMVKVLKASLEGEGFSILNSDGKLPNEMGKILSLIKQYDMVLATGHISPAETFAVVGEALKAGINKILITHPWESLVSEKVMSMKEIQQLAAMGALIEFCAIGLLPTAPGHTPASVAAAIRSIGPKHCIMSTDGGQVLNPPPPEAMRLFMAAMLTQGMTSEEIELMAKVNPSRLLGLD